MLRRSFARMSMLMPPLSATFSPEIAASYFFGFR
jgi:hypothetical protein